MAMFTVTYQNEDVSAEEQSKLILAMKSGDPKERIAARNKFVASYYRLVTYVCLGDRRITQDNADDVVQFLMIGLLRAAELFDPARLTRFVTYATWCLKGQIQLYFEQQERQKRGCVGVYEEYGNIPIEDAVVARPQDVDHDIDFINDWDRAMIMIARLNIREQYVIRRRHAIDGGKGTLQEVGKELGITKERVRQLQQRAERRLAMMAKDFR
jgi:RNA polymerase sigma factor (sigma-70 family)